MLADGISIGDEPIADPVPFRTDWVESYLEFVRREFMRKWLGIPQATAVVILAGLEHPSYSSQRLPRA